MSNLSKQPTAVICMSPYIGGMELASLKLTKTLSQYTDLTFIIQEGKFIHQQCLNNPDYQKIRFETIAFSKNFSPSIIFNTRKIIQTNKIKNIIFFGASELKSLYFSFLGLDTNLIIRHGSTKSTPKKDWFHRLIYSNVNYHVPISKYMSENVKRIIPFGVKSRMKVIIPSLPKPISILTKTSSDTLRLLHIGRVTLGKGVHTAILSCSILEEIHIPFSFDNFGPSDPKYFLKLQQLIHSLSYQNCIHINGFTDSIYDEYQKHDIFIFPPLGEGYGNVMMEAISHGIIVLAFDNTAISNFGEMGFHIHLVKDGDLDALKERLLFIAQNLEEEKKLAVDNIEKAAHIFASTREAEEYLELLI
jgi:glycosyltransferase involved in cell wall biosynthesis